MIVRRNHTRDGGEVVHSGYATFSECGKYRYNLGRLWHSGPSVCFVMLNPSMANEIRLDPTVTRCVNYAKKWGFGSMEVVNLFPYIATDPKDMLDAKNSGLDITGGVDGEEALLRTTGNDFIVAAWGAIKVAVRRANQFLTFTHPHPIHCLRITKSGQPYHPLYQRADLKPIPFARCK